MKTKIGAAREIITPKLGGLFAGYGSKMPSDSVNDELTVTALAIESGQNKVLFMSLSLCFISNDLWGELRSGCGKAAGVPAANVIISCTHTHSGPLISSNAEDDYCSNILVPKCIAAAGNSVKDMKQAKMGIAVCSSFVGMNRRQVLSDDRVILGQNPWGPYDSEMTVISFKGDDGKPAANLIHCTAHNTAAGIVTTVSRDWCGVMTDRLETESGAITAFFNGCAGDVCPRSIDGKSAGGGIKYAMELGGIAGRDAVKTYKDIREYRDIDLAVASGEIRIPYEPIKPLETARQQYAEVEHGDGRWDEGYRTILKEIIDLHEKGNAGPDNFVVEQTIVRIGPAVFVPIPFEASTEISMRLRAYSKFGYTLALGYTNGYYSYLPTQDQMCRGGYEVERFKWTAARQLPVNTDTQLINANLKIMESFSDSL